jgi:hypothetical protein
MTATCHHGPQSFKRYRNIAEQSEEKESTWAYAEGAS